MGYYWVEITTSLNKDRYRVYSKSTSNAVMKVLKENKDKYEYLSQLEITVYAD